MKRTNDSRISRRAPVVDAVPGLHLERPAWPKDDEIVGCPVCSCTWLEQIQVQQYGKDHFVILGQQVSPKTGVTFILFRCPKCNEIIEPNVQSAPQDTFRKGYDNFLDQMETPFNGKDS